MTNPRIGTRRLIRQWIHPPDAPPALHTSAATTTPLAEQMKRPAEVWLGRGRSFRGCYGERTRSISSRLKACASSHYTRFCTGNLVCRFAPWCSLPPDIAPHGDERICPYWLTVLAAKLEGLAIRTEMHMTVSSVSTAQVTVTTSARSPAPRQRTHLGMNRSSAKSKQNSSPRYNGAWTMPVLTKVIVWSGAHKMGAPAVRPVYLAKPVEVQNHSSRGHKNVRATNQNRTAGADRRIACK